MVLKLKNNPILEIKSASGGTASTVSDNFKGKASGLMIEGCPCIDASSIFNSVTSYQSSRTHNLTNIRLQLDYNSGTYSRSGTFDELSGMSVANGVHLSGFESNGIERQKPALIGTWNITDYVDGEMLDALSGIGGIYNADEPTLSSNYRIDWNNIAIQSVDPTKPNYNPAVAIILNSKNLGNSHDNVIHFPGKWWMTNDEMSKVRNIHTWFSGVSAVEDVYGIVSSSKSTYPFTNFDAFSGFTGVTSLDASAFGNNSNLASIRLPNTICSIPERMLKGSNNVVSIGSIPDSVRSIQASAFDGCSNLVIGNIGNNVDEIEQKAFNGCTNAEFSSLPQNLKYVPNSAFNGCTKITVSEIPSSVSFVGTDAFNGCANIPSMSVGRYNSRITVLSGAFDYGEDYPIYVGTKDSSCLSERLIRDYSDDGLTSAYDGRLSSGYTKHYSSLVPSDYEIQKYIASDGITIINPEEVYVNGTTFESDIAFYSGSGDFVHGTKSIGLTSDAGKSVYAHIGDVTTNIISVHEKTSYPHNYALKLKTSAIELDGVEIFKSYQETNGDNVQIKLFGDEYDAFIGKSWMGRITKDGVVVKDLVPVKRIADNRLGFYDVKSGRFYQGGDNYSSDSVILAPSSTGYEGIITESGLVIEF